MIGKEYFAEKKISMIMVLLLLLVGSIMYFVSGASDNASMMDSIENSNIKSNTDTNINSAINSNSVSVDTVDDVNAVKPKKGILV